MNYRLVFFLSALFSTIQIFSQELVWHNPQSEKFHVVNGQGWPSELKGSYNRFPARCEGIVRESVWDLSQHSAGLYVKFKTNSPSIHIRYGITGDIQMPHMPATGVSGVDLYSKDENNRLRWHATGHNRSFSDTTTFKYNNLTYETKDTEGYEFTLYLPLYNHVEWLEVGVEQSSHFRFLPASIEKPIVVYGTSIAQGACCTRPGMAWTNIVQRDMDTRVINLGFSGNGQMEPEVFTLLSELDASIFVIDCMANMDFERTDLIYERTLNGVRILRSKTDAPIILVEHAGYSFASTSETIMEKPINCNIELNRAYRTLLQEGIHHLFLLPNSENAYGLDEMVEGIHPNDIGMMHQATVTEKYIHIATN